MENKKYSDRAHEAIRISGYRTCDDIDQAREIVDVFCEEKGLHISEVLKNDYSFLRMLGAIWASGYISAKRETRQSKAR